MLQRTPKCRSVLAAVVAASVIASAKAADLSGRIVAVSDGDTVTLLDASKTQHRIRLDGIDAPERGQAFGQRSKESMSDLAFGRAADAQCHKTDRYGREVCKVVVNGTDIALEQIRRGMAWHFKRYSHEQ